MCVATNEMVESPNLQLHILTLLFVIEGTLFFFTLIYIFIMKKSPQSPRSLFPKVQFSILYCDNAVPMI